MAVVPLTLTISLCLVFTFVVFFLREHARGRFSSAERDSLLPLAEEEPRLATATAPRDATGHGGGGCQDASRTP
jgi:cbb3-type cytochrome oxidase subunit 3